MRPIKPDAEAVVALLRSSWKGSSDELENVIDAIIEPMLKRFCPPLMVTSPTPDTWEIFWARRVSV